MAPSEEVEIAMDAHAMLGEGPIWDDGTRCLVWVDIMEGHLHRYDPATGSSETMEVGQPVGAAAVRSMGGFVLALRDGFGLVERWGDEVRMIADTEADIAGNRMNDGKCDLTGRFFAGTMAFAVTPGAGALYRLETDYSVTKMVGDLTISNGIGWSIDNRTMYHIDTPAHTLYAYDYDAATGSMGNRRSLIEVDPGDGSPDGMTVDAEGFLWVALYGGGAVRRYSPEGDLVRTIALPATNITSCTFGGDGLSDLYITSAAQELSEDQLAREPHAGALWRCSPGIKGLPPNDFKA
ncbi:MAG: SMP-30/gluconolactonase/LRE family protein [Actinobacteria bacterium]|nr:SMP-30/gluconolactonase/LRE family protein [Actinomycetota bacterium]